MKIFWCICIMLFTSVYIYGEEPKRVYGIWYNSYHSSLQCKEEVDRPLIAQHLQTFHDMGINRIYYLVKFPTGHVFYNSKIAPKYNNLDWDPFRFIIQECKKLGIQVYPYINVLCKGQEVGFTDAKDEKNIFGPYLKQHPDQCMVRNTGELTGWVSPRLKKVQQRTLDIIDEIIDNYEIDGFQLDRFRYPDTSVDYHPETVAQYKAQYNVEPNQKDYRWTKFRQESLTNFLRILRQHLQKKAPHLPLSVAVFPHPKTAPKYWMQNWPLWAREGLVDEIASMAYARTLELLDTYVHEEQEATPPNIPLVYGLSAYFSVITPELLEQQIQVALTQSPQGILFFSGFHILQPEFIPIVTKYGKLIQKQP